MSGATASYPTSDYNALATAVLPRWLNDRRTRDIIHRATPFAWYMFSKARYGEIPQSMNIRLNNVLGTGVTRFKYYDQVSTTPIAPGSAARFTAANYDVPITISWEEMLETSGRDAICDHIERVSKVQLLAMVRTFAEDMYRGNAINTKSIVGLEQLAYALTQWDNTSATYTVPTSLSYIKDTWRARQATNVVGGITRTGFSTADNGTGWENVAVDLDPAGNQTNVFGFSSGAKNAAMIAMDQAYRFTSYGMEKPDLIVSTNMPYDDYIAAMDSKITVFKEENTLSDVQYGFKNLKFQNAVWFPDDFALAYDDVGSADEVAGTDKIYIINTDYTYLMIDSRANFALGPELQPVDQHAYTRHVVLRGQLVSENPRTLGVVFNYGA